MIEIPDTLIDQATSGNRKALEDLFHQIQGPVYQLSVRMLWHPEDAKDAAQEILIKVLTNLSNFERRSRFGTWVYRIAVNHLLNFRASRMERMELSWTAFAEDLTAGLGKSSPEDALLIEEIKIGCTHGMLLCLDRPHRMAYVLGEITEFNGAEAAGILNITPEAFRKRLSRARSLVSKFTGKWCGLVRPGNDCRCDRRTHHAISTGRVDPAHLQFAPASKPGDSPAAILHRIRQLDEVQGTAELYRSNGELSIPDGFMSSLDSLLG
jgi:RNA polymerase sigma factor (sigma-70 family)